MNDFEGLFGIEKYIKEIKYIVCPNKIHVAHEPSNINIKDYLDKFGFNGKIIRYEMHTNKNPNKLLQFVHTKSSGDVIYHFFNMCNNRENKLIHIYGMYNSLEDNQMISYLIVNPQLPVEDKYNKFFKE